MSYLKHIAAILVTGFAASAFAAPIAFNLTSPTSRVGTFTDTGGNLYATQYNYSAATHNGVALEVTGWSYGNVTTGCKTKRSDGKCTAVNTTTYASGTAHQDVVGQWSGGLGVEYDTSPEHAINNAGNDFDMLLLTFSEAVSLNSINLGWIDGNNNAERLKRSDISILAGTSETFASPLNQSWQSLVGNGWQLEGNYNGVGLGNETVNDVGIIASKYWLVGAYNSTLGSAISGNDTYNDSFKLSSVSVEKAIVKVPEPSALFLFGLGLLGLVAVRRRAA